MSDEVVIRTVDADERAAWEPLWNGHLAFYKMTLVPGASDVAWARFHDPAENDNNKKRKRPCPIFRT